jgi:hypothetical protein
MGMRVMVLAALMVAGCMGGGLPAESSSKCCDTPAGVQCYAIEAVDGPTCSASCEACSTSADCCDGLHCNMRGFCAVPTTR